MTRGNARNYQIWKVMCIKRHNCKILLEITSGSLYALVPVPVLSLCPSYREVTPPTDIRNIQISGYIRPVLNLQ